MTSHSFAHTTIGSGRIFSKLNMGRQVWVGEFRPRKTLAGQSPEMSVVQGTEVLTKQDDGGLIDSMAETRQKMSSLKETLLSPTETTTDAVSDQEPFVNLKESIDLDAMNHVITNAVKKLSEEVSNVKSDITAAGSSTSTRLTSLVDKIHSSVGQLAQQMHIEVGKDINEVSNALESAQNSILNQMPPGVRDTSAKAFLVINEFSDAYKENPEGYTMVISILLGVSLIIGYSTVYGGYSGVFQPEQAMDILQNKDAVLVDIREEENRQENGVPLLKLGARGKGVAIPYPTLPSSVIRQVSNSQLLLTDILAEQIKSISKISKETIVIVMDSKGNMSRDVSRACTKVGVKKVYFMDGGFAKYQRQGLKVDGRDFYEDGPLAIAADRAEELTEETKSIAKKPLYTFAGIGSLSALIFAVSHFHEVLRFVGVLGVEITVALRFLSYDSAEDFTEDIRSVADSVRTMYNYPKNLIQTVAKSSKNASS